MKSDNKKVYKISLLIW